MLPTADICDNFPTKVLVVKPIFKDFGGKTAFYGKAITLKTHDDNTKVKKALESNGGNKVLVVEMFYYSLFIVFPWTYQYFRCVVYD